MVRFAAFLVLALALGACASYSGSSLQPGVATEAQVRESMGAPAMEFANPDGSRQLVFPRGPLGTATFMADVGRDGKLIGIRQVLNDDVFYRIQPGQTEEEVLRTIGPPGQTMGFPLSGNYAWDYRFTDTWGYVAIFSVTFNRDRIVVSKISQRIERDKGMR
jgi:hypothetical protein